MKVKEIKNDCYRNEQFCMNHIQLIGGNMNKKSIKIVVMGLGYVGINIAYALSKKATVIGFDINKKLIKDYTNGIDNTNEIGNEKIKNSKIIFTYDKEILNKADVIIVAVPTPIDENYKPDLTLLYSASKMISNNLKNDTLIIFESTVSPGTTDEITRYIEKQSKLKEGVNFFVGYSPERINPGDKKNKIDNSVKIISANRKDTLEKMFNIYNLIINKKNIHIVDEIKIAEATKVIENTQRDVNIAFMNEMTRYLYDKGISSKKVLEAMNTKWNALGFTHGLVGGHCIGVDPYYLINSVKNSNELTLVKTARNENELFSKYLAKRIKKIVPKNKKIGILGFTYKPNVNDIRNTKVYDLIKELEKYGYEVEVSDCLANSEKMYNEYHIDNKKELIDVDVIILAVSHNYYIDNLDKILKMYKKSKSKKILFDLYNILDINDSCELKIERI